MSTRSAPVQRPTRDGIGVSRGAATALLARMRSGDSAASGELYCLLYEELRRLARRQVGRRGPESLQATALVHEAWVRLASHQAQGWRDREHFLAVAARAMRFILVDAARRRLAAKREAPGRPQPLDESLAVQDDRALELLALDEALGRLVRRDERQARIVELRFHGGLAMPDAARVLGVSLATAERLWSRARAFLGEQLGGDPLEVRPGAEGARGAPDRTLIEGARSGRVRPVYEP